MTDLGVAVRFALPGDAATVASMADELRRSLGDETGHLTAERIAADAFGSEPEVSILVADADEDDRLAGYALYTSAYEPAFAARGLYLADLYVRPAYRRKGIATALISAVARAARREGRTFVWWVTPADNPVAQAFYDTLPAQNRKDVQARALILPT